MLVVQEIVSLEQCYICYMEIQTFMSLIRVAGVELLTKGKNGKTYWK